MHKFGAPLYVLPTYFAGGSVFIFILHSKDEDTYMLCPLGDVICFHKPVS